MEQKSRKKTNAEKKFQNWNKIERLHWRSPHAEAEPNAVILYSLRAFFLWVYIFLFYFEREKEKKKRIFHRVQMFFNLIKSFKEILI